MTTYLIFPVFINTKVLSNIQEHRCFNLLKMFLKIYIQQTFVKSTLFYFIYYKMHL